MIGKGGVNAAFFKEKNMSLSNCNIQIVGRIGQDATIRQVQDYYAISFSVAVSEKRKNDQQATAWFNCTYWVKSDKIAQYLTKGKLVSVVADWFDVTEKDGKTFTNFRVKELNPFLEKNTDTYQSTQTERITDKPIEEDIDDDLPF